MFNSSGAAPSGATNIFGQTPQGVSFGTSVSNSGAAFGNISAQPVFGSTMSSSTFGSVSSTSGFGSFSGAQASGSSLFGVASSQNPQNSVFGAASSGSGVGTALSQNSTFGTAPAFGTATSPFGSGNPQGSVFGTSGNAPVFGGTGFHQTSTFGSTTEASFIGQRDSQNSNFGSNASGSVFGQNSAQGPALGASTFGQGTSQSSVFGSSIVGSGFGQNSSQSSVFGATSSAPVFGQGSSQASVFGGSDIAMNATSFGIPLSQNFVGANTTSVASAPFGASSIVSSSTGFGGASTQGSIFGTSTSISFGGPSSQNSGFLPSTSISTFGAVTTKDSNIATSSFEAVASSGSIFGSSAGVSSTQGAAFGNSGTETFAAIAQKSVFGTQFGATTQGSVFGSTTGGAAGPFGSSTGSLKPFVFGVASSSSGNVFHSSVGTSTSNSSATGTTVSAASNPFGLKPSSLTSAVVTSAGSPGTLGSKDGTFSGSKVFGTTGTSEAGSKSSVSSAGSTTVSSRSSFAASTTAPVFGAPSKNVFGGAGSKVFGDSAATNVFGSLTSTSNSGNVFSKPSTEQSQPRGGRDGRGRSGEGKSVSPSRDAREERGLPDASQRLFKQAVSRVATAAPATAAAASAAASISTTGKGWRDEGGVEEKEEGEISDNEGPPVVASKKPSLRRWARQPSSRRISSTDSPAGSSTAERVAIVARNVPSSFLDQQRLRQHFSRFGKIKRLFINSTLHSVTVHFADHASAADAKANGTVLAANEHPINIFWRNTDTTKSLLPSAQRHAGSETSEHSRFRSDRQKVAGSELDEELSSMHGTADYDLAERRAPDRPAVRAVKQSKQQEDQQKSDSGSSGQALSNRPAHSNSPVPRPAGTSEEPRLEPATSAPSDGGATALPSTLSSVIAHTAADRYVLLESRDKILRAAQNAARKNTDLATAAVIQGSCQDMCPEKERYMREDRRRVSVYEVLTGDVEQTRNPLINHARAVKEYSRSSADQEMPLPNEMRPVDVLDRTMNYLLSNIADLGGPGLWGDWFDFLWNRTRAIRKDITQQQLCSLQAVALVEKCARFHVYCAEVLCTEDPSIFDMKINDENLTKCLQTLKEMYHDLAVKKGVVCDREAEFRGYMLLMNLNEGDSLREVQQLREEVRDAPEIEFGVSVYSALNGHNYVRFFRLVRQARFLEACILHRYFNQIRTHALQCILRAYYLPGQLAQYPLAELRRQLGFEDDLETSEFCRHHGLTLSQDESCLVQDRTQFISPESLFSVRRSVELVEAKLSCSVGEVINGSPLPSMEILQPTSSFDENGRLVSTGLQAEQNPVLSQGVAMLSQGVTMISQGASKQKSSVIPSSFDGMIIEPTPRADVARPTDAPQQPGMSKEVNEAIRDIAKDLFHEVIREVCVGMSQGSVGAIKRYLGLSEVIAPDLLSTTVDYMVKVICTEVLIELKNEEEERVARERALVSALCEQTVSEVIEDYVLESAYSVTRECYSQQLDEDRERQTELGCERIVEELIYDLTTEEGAGVGGEVYSVDVLGRLRELDRCEHLVRQRRLRQYWNTWMDVCMYRQRRKRSMETFPAAPSMTSWQRGFTYLLPDSRGMFDVADELGGATGLWTYLELGAQLKVNLRSRTVADFESRQLLGDIEQKSRDIEERAAMTDAALVLVHHIRASVPREHFLSNPASCFYSSDQSKFYWKLVLALPTAQTSQDSAFNAWLKNKFKNGTVPDIRRKSQQIELLSLFSAPLDDEVWYQDPLTQRSSMGVCGLSFTGDLVERRLSRLDQRHLVGTSALIFVVDVHRLETVEGQRKERVRFQDLLSNCPPVPALPVIVALNSSHPPDLADIVSVLELNSELIGRRISHYTVCTLGDDRATASQQLGEGLSWLCNHYQPLPPIASRTLREFVEDTLQKEFYEPLLGKLSDVKERGLTYFPPGVLILMYNETLKWITDVLTNQNLCNISWPVTEFFVEPSPENPCPGVARPDWNQESERAWLWETVLSASLPMLEGGDKVTEDCDWRTACEDVWAYVCEIVEEASEHNSAPALFSRISLLLEAGKRSSLEGSAAAGPAVRATAAAAAAGPAVDGAKVPWIDIVLTCIDFKLSNIDYMDPQATEVELMVHYLADNLSPGPGLVKHLQQIETELSVRELALMNIVEKGSVHVSNKRKLPEPCRETAQPTVTKHSRGSAALISSTPMLGRAIGVTPRDLVASPIERQVAMRIGSTVRDLRKDSGSNLRRIGSGAGLERATAEFYAGDEGAEVGVKEGGGAVDDNSEVGKLRRLLDDEKAASSAFEEYLKNSVACVDIVPALADLSEADLDNTSLMVVPSVVNLEDLSDCSSPPVLEDRMDDYRFDEDISGNRLAVFDLKSGHYADDSGDKENELGFVEGFYHRSRNSWTFGERLKTLNDSISVELKENRMAEQRLFDLLNS